MSMHAALQPVVVRSQASIVQRSRSTVKHEVDFVYCQQHDPVGREGAQQAWREALVESPRAALRPQFLHITTIVRLSSVC